MQCTQELQWLHRHFHKHISTSFASKDQQNWQICLSKTIISNTMSHKSLQQHFTTMTCWHFISTYFLRASFAVIFLVLASSFQRWRSVVKRIVLCTVSSLWTLMRGKKRQLRARTRRLQLCQVRDWLLISYSTRNIFVFSMCCCFILQNRLWSCRRSGPPLSVFDKLSWTLCISECQFVKYPKWGVTCLQLKVTLGYSTDWPANSTAQLHLHAKETESSKARGLKCNSEDMKRRVHSYSSSDGDVRQKLSPYFVYNSTTLNLSWLDNSHTLT